MRRHHTSRCSTTQTHSFSYYTTVAYFCSGRKHFSVSNRSTFCRWAKLYLLSQLSLRHSFGHRLLLQASLSAAASRQLTVELPPKAVKTKSGTPHPQHHNNVILCPSTGGACPRAWPKQPCWSWVQEGVAVWVRYGVLPPGKIVKF